MTAGTTPPARPRCAAVVDLMAYDRPLKAAASQLRRLARERRDRFDMTDAETVLLLIGELDALRRVIRKAGECCGNATVRSEDR